jgi:hypothetical protein
VGSTTLSSPKTDGNSLQPSALAVVRPSILIDSESYEVTVNTLVIILLALLSETLSSDKMSLALFSARRDALNAGIPEEEFERVVEIVSDAWQVRRAANPLSRMF